MAVAVDTSVSKQDITGLNPSITQAITIAGGATMLAVAFSHDDFRSVSSVVCNSVGMTEAVNVLEPNDTGYRTHIYYLANPTTGNIVITLSGNSEIHMSGISFTGSDTAPGATASQDKTSSTMLIQTSITTTRNNSYVVEGTTTGTATTAFAADGGQTEIANFVSSIRFGSSYKSCPTAGSNTLGWSWATTNRQAAQALLEIMPPAPVASTPSAANLLTMGV